MRQLQAGALMARNSDGLSVFLGCHQPAWLSRAGVPLFVSHRRLVGRNLDRMPRANCSFAVDSGAFSELSMYGEWRTDPFEYVQWVKAYDLQIGTLDFAAPQDWPCEPSMVERTGLSVREHQERTVANFIELCSLWEMWDSKFMGVCQASCPFMPVLQGWTLDDYFLRTIAWCVALGFQVCDLAG
jgi:hypothetical protein